MGDHLRVAVPFSSVSGMLLTNHTLGKVDPSTTGMVATAAIIALSRWFAISEIIVSIGVGKRECRAAIRPGMTAKDISDLLESSVHTSALDDLLIIPAQAAGTRDLPGLRARCDEGLLRFDSTGADNVGLAELASRLFVAISNQPAAELSELAPARFAPVDGREPPALHGLNRKLTSSCIDMATGEALTGEQLERRTVAISRLLLDHGVGPGTIVGVALPRGVNSIAAWVAILRLGAGFLHLDSELSIEQRQQMLEDSAPAFLLVDSPELAVQLGGPARALNLPTGDTVLPAVVCDSAGPEDPAYLIFTSGSSGKPKAVMIGHGALDHHSRAVSAAFELTPQDRVLSFAALGFDVAIEEILPTLRAGATLVLRSDEMLNTLERFVDELHSQRITVLNLPTAFWRLLTDNLQHPSSRGLPRDLRLVIVGGERVPSTTLEQWRTVAPSVIWMNGYGPTETTITATLHVDQGAPLEMDSVPIGAPLGAARLVLLAPDGSPAPPGRPGEMWIGGVGVGLGYVNRPNQTAERFRALPGSLGRRYPGRWYRTGDRVQPTSSGDLVFMDRMDRQIKLSGYRIEPAGIETALTKVPGVREARIAVQHGALAVWVAGEADPCKIRRVLRAELPKGVSPRLMILSEMPRNERGKLNEAALRDIMASAVTQPGFVDPAKPAAATIGRIMGKLLGQPPLNAEQSFFDQGGNSLMAIELSEHLVRVFGRRPTVPAIYNHPTPQALARMMEAGSAFEDSLIAVQPEGDGVPLLGIHVLGTNGDFYRPLADALQPRHPVWGITVGLLTPETPTDIDGLAELYFRQVQEFRPYGPLALAGVSLGAFVAFELAARLHRAGRDVAMVAIFDADGPAPSRRSTALDRLGRATSLMWHNPGAALCRYSARAKGELTLALRVIWLRLGRLLGRKSDQHNLDDFVAANIVSVAAYKPAVYPGRVVVFAAQDDLANTERVRKTALGWASVAPDRRFVCISGDHLGILREPGVRDIARVIQEELGSISPGS
ncbi:amino acid adenylation domain-containing protein [Paracoccus benzoatiresistens]|uniref:Amino acid adenylation domain-containing protein n=1 Tax=Paracoccus benzoatiresistens TaxID=2997341 RepID=A0ABT4J896_9RHOB|nr:amino acid adenylation domain-containing protein [Paracoccus sp. EF6]MCZ0963316.1 amino acid adenylation domain-containing protein [Paracoccus sp. EF6]